MTARGTMTTVPCVTFTRTLPGPVEKVWAHITDTRLLPAWFGDNSTIEPRQGGRVSLMGGHIRGTVTQWQPPKKLVYTWNVFGPDDAADAVSAFPESYPTFELEARGSGVALTFTHFPILERFVPQNAMGWHTMLDIIEAVVRTGKSEERRVYTQKNAALYGVDLNALQR
ncbi:MAG: SRPBCC domain-containing protein [Alphaproteobacteria bacterium]|nr:SRPBCC domain-containing protein [Alphaproteobacteria bacterium]MBL7096882.1 SRPBCC domain-containing protein [Alphaproteobacteria bacterium]